MREYKLKIKGGSDFVIVSPKVIAALVKEIYNTPQKELSVAVEKIMPEDFTQYLMRVINSNRYTNDQFRFREILEDPITNQHIYQILQEQLGEMRMDDKSCFEYFELESVDGEEKPIGSMIVFSKLHFSSSVIQQILRIIHFFRE